MKREKAAAALLLSLIILSGWNIRRIQTLCRSIDTQLVTVEESTAGSDFAAAEAAALNALGLWLDAEGYTHIFIRHPEIDTTSDVFYELLEAVKSRESESMLVNTQKLRYHVQSMAKMEKLSFGSIF